VTVWRYLLIFVEIPSCFVVREKPGRDGRAFVLRGGKMHAAAKWRQTDFDETAKACKY